jgi:hypothetical protein
MPYALSIVLSLLLLLPFGPGLYPDGKGDAPDQLDRHVISFADRGGIISYPDGEGDTPDQHDRRVISLAGRGGIISYPDGNGDKPYLPGRRVITFAGHKWIVSETGERGKTPGPNFFSSSEENVWVDRQGRLHLKITHSNGRWECAEVIRIGAVSHGEYTFRILSDINGFDKNIVAGLFLYRDDQNEADIEFSRWGDEDSDAGQFTVQPSDREGNLFRFPVEKARKASTHIINWQKEYICFTSYNSHSPLPRERLILGGWKYSGEDIPAETKTKVIINLWLFRGTPPSDQKEAELIIENVKFKD